MNKKLKVVIADDMELLLISMKAILEANSKVEGVWTALDGEDEIIKIMRVQPDVVFTDMQMPKRTGLDVIQAIQDYPSVRKKPKFILMTGRTDGILYEKSRELGFDIVQKPISRQRINDIINELEPIKIDEKEEKRKRKEAFKIMRRELEKEECVNSQFRHD